MESRRIETATLPRPYAIISSALLFALAVIIIALEGSTKVEIDSLVEKGYVYDIHLATTVGGFYIGLAALTILSVLVDGLDILHQVSTLNFVGIFLSFLIWIPRINAIETLSGLRPPYPAVIEKLIVVFVFALLECILCFINLLFCLLSLRRRVIRV